MRDGLVAIAYLKLFCFLFGECLPIEYMDQFQGSVYSQK